MSEIGPNDRPYTVDSLAERWDCSPSHIRKMIAAGDLAAFGIGGKLLRIAASEVARIESGNIWTNQNTGSHGTGESSPSLGTKTASDSAAHNPPCCNPAHLFLGTAGDNARDMHRKGRGNKDAPKGSRNGFSKLNETQVTAILGRIRAGDTNTAIARDFGVHHSTISLIRNRKKWKHVPKEAA